jgi:hypothetical protein
MSTPTAPQKPAPTKATEAEVATHPTPHRHPLHEAGGAAGGALAGAAVGSIAGPAGAAAGAVIGGVVGAIVAKISDEEADRVSFHDGELDAEIGVNGGDLGAPNLLHPPAIRGTYSAGSAGGGGTSGGGSSEGPMPAPKD